MSRAVTSAPASPSVCVPRPAPRPRTMPPTTATPAPCVMPSVSGLARGLRVRVWKIAPDTPKAAPASSPASARGSRSSWTMSRPPGSPPPHSAGTASVTGSGYSPVVRLTHRTAKAAPASTAQVASSRGRRIADTGGRASRTAVRPASRETSITVTSPSRLGRSQLGEAASADQRDEERRPEERRHDPDVDLLGTGHDPPGDVGGQQQAGGQQRGQREEPALVRPAEGAHGVRDDQPDEHDGPGDRDGRAGEEHHRQGAQHAHAPQPASQR